MPAHILREPSDAYTTPVDRPYLADEPRVRKGSAMSGGYGSSRRGSVSYDYVPVYEEDRRQRGRERPRYFSAEDVERQRRSMSDRDSYGRSSRTPDRSESSRKSRQVPHIIEDSRPPVSSSRGLGRHSYATPEVIYVDGPLRRENSTSSRRSRSRSSPSRFSRWFGGGGSSTRAPSPERPPRRERRSRSEKPSRLSSCVVCLEDVSSSKGADLKCGHRMCNSCLRRIFRMSITDPQHMPPRCCTADHIPLRYVDRLFDSDFKKTWNRKFDEYTARTRLYCPSRKCGEWIKPEAIKRENGRKVARCGRCKTRMCVSCGFKAHGSAPCPRDEETTRFLSQAAEEGWKRCYNCKAMVELKEGCNHMTCRCGAEFCMQCGAKWKGCDCPWFNHDARGADYLENMNIPSRTREYPQTYTDEMRLRRLQEMRDRVVARNMQEDDGYEMSGGLGDVTGISNGAGHFMNDSYRREPPLSRHPPAFDRGAGYVNDVNRARGYGGGYPERRPSGRDRRQSPPAAPLRYSMGPSDYPLRREPPTRRSSLDEGRYSSGLGRSRSERVAPGRASRRYEDEAAAHAPRPSYRRRRSEDVPRGSSMAGLNGKERGMGRVNEWMTYVEPGVPDGESVVGHV